MKKILSYFVMIVVLIFSITACITEEDDSNYQMEQERFNLCGKTIEYNGTWDGDLILTDNLCIDGILVIPGNLYTAGYNLSFTGNLTVEGTIYLGGGNSFLEHSGESLIFNHIRGYGTLDYCPLSTVTPMGDLFPNTITIINNCQ